MHKELHLAQLECVADADFLPALLAAVDHAARRCGMAPASALRLQLAAEEIFLYAVGVVEPQDKITVLLACGGYYAAVDFLFHSASADMRALNLTSDARAAAPDSSELGLLIASRTVDRCRLEHTAPDLFRLRVETDKTYPQVPCPPCLETFAPPFALDDAPPADLLSLAACLALGRYQPWECPGAFATPGLLVDMVAADKWKVILALDAASRPAGLFCWRKTGAGAAAFSGPYILAPNHGPQLSVALTERFLQRVARQDVLCAVSECPTNDVPAGYFDHLGETHHRCGPNDCVRPAHYRLLGEDLGGLVWSYPDMDGFLRREYDRMAFMREILPAPRASSRRGHSLLTAVMDRAKEQAVLRPALDGEDIAANLADHVAALEGQGLVNIFCHIDLSCGWQAALAPELLAVGFVPRIILPHTGRSDMLVYQYAPAR